MVASSGDEQDVSGSGSSYLAKWGCQDPGPAVYCTAKASSIGCSGSLAKLDLGALITGGRDGWQRPERVIEAVKSLRCKSVDRVLFYYAGRRRHSRAAASSSTSTSPGLTARSSATRCRHVGKDR